jgi:predicted lipoprotein
MFLRLISAALLTFSYSTAHADALGQRWHDEQLVPRFDALKQSANQLAGRAAEMCSHTNAEKLDATRTAWVATFTAWRALEALPIDPAARKAIEPGSVEIPIVEGAVRVATADKPIADNPDASSMGLRALEYLLWGNDRASAQLGRLAFHQRCIYAQAVAAALPAQVDALRAADLNQAATEANYLASLGQALRQWRGTRMAKLGEAKTLPHSVTASDFDAWRSKQTKAALGASLATAESLLLGPNGSGGYLADHFTGDADATQLSELRDAFATAQATLQKLPDDLPDTLGRNSALAAPLLTSLRQIQAVVDALAVSPAAAKQPNNATPTTTLPVTGG